MWFLRIRHVHERHDMASWPVPFAVCDHAYNFDVGTNSVSRAAGNVQTDWSAPDEEPLCQFFIDDARLGACGAVRVVEFPSSDEWNAQSREIIRANICP